MRSYRAFPLLVAALFPASGLAQEITLHAGKSDTADGNRGSYTWALDYRHTYKNYFAASVSWINEGHLGDHHRDGYAGQVWVQTPLFDDHFSLALGGGLYRFFDTVPDAAGGSRNLHSTATLVSMSATYYTAGPWLARFTVNHVKSGVDITTNLYSFGVGYRVWRRAGGLRPARDGAREHQSEVAAFVGRTIVNTYESEVGLARALEFRHGIARNFDWSASWINEGDPGIIRRNGVASQVWVVGGREPRQVILGFGAGGYYALDQRREPAPGEGAQHQLAGLVTLTVGYRFTAQWAARANWNRVVTNYNRDTDVIMLGVGYRWGGTEGASTP